MSSNDEGSKESLWGWRYGMLTAAAVASAGGALWWWWRWRRRRDQSTAAAARIQAEEHKVMTVDDVPELMDKFRDTYNKTFLTYDARNLNGLAPSRHPKNSPNDFTTSLRVCTKETMVQGPQIVGLTSHRLDVSAALSTPLELNLCAANLLKTVTGAGNDEFFFAARDTSQEECDIVNGSLIMHARLLRGDAMRDEGGKLRWKGVGVLEQWAGPSVVLQCSVALSSAMDITKETRRQRAAWGGDVLWGSGESRNRATEWHVRAFDVSLLWIAMSSEFGDVLVKPRHIEGHPTTLLMGNGDPVFALNIVNNSTLVVGCQMHLSVYHLGDNGSVTCFATELVSTLSIISLGTRLPLNVWLVTSKPLVTGYALSPVTEEPSQILVGQTLRSINMEELLDDAIKFPAGKAVACVAPHPTFDQVFAVGSFGGWCAVLGLEETTTQVYQCQGYGDLESGACLVARWNPVLPHILAFSDCGITAAAVSAVHVVDVRTQSHQVVTLSNVKTIHGLDWCPSGATLFVLVPNQVIEFRLSPANLSLKDWATLW